MVSRVDLLQVADLTPNIGLQWYFFQEMFAHFRPFWHFVFHAAAAAMVGYCSMTACWHGACRRYEHGAD